MQPAIVPELLSPAGSLDAARAAIANGADAVYLGAQRFNARDEGAQLTLDELDEACRLAHERGKRVYLTLNTLVKPAELADALELLGDAIDRGVDAAIVQDVGLVRLIGRVFPGFEVHGSTQMTVHDAAGAAVMRDLGVRRVVLARENTLQDVCAIHAAVPELELEAFVHGALCISYSGQCFMSGMISERSANRGSCAQSCRKDYTLADAVTGATLDSGFLISAKDLAAAEHLTELARAGVACLKIEGRKKKPEYVATVTRSYREFLARVARGEPVGAVPDASPELVQIYSRGFTGGMLGERAGRDYITRDQPDNRGVVLGTVIGYERGELLVDVAEPIEPGDGLGFEPPEGGEACGFAVSSVRTIGAGRGSRPGTGAGAVRQALPARERIPLGWRVVRTSHASLLRRARESYAALVGPLRARRARIDVRVFGSPGAHLRAVFAAGGETVTVRSEAQLAPARQRPLDAALLRDHLGRLGDTPFALGSVDIAGLDGGLFIPVSELNRLRQRAVDELLARRDWAEHARLAERRAAIGSAIAELPVGALAARGAHPAAHVRTDPVPGPHQPSAERREIAPADGTAFRLTAEVYRVEDARAAARGGATEIIFDPFLRHPMPPVARVRALQDHLAERGVGLRLRTPSVVRPRERRLLDKWLALGTGLSSGHLGLVAELSRAGRDVAADYAVNCFNQHAAAELFRLGASRVVLSIELTAEEMAAAAAPWDGRGFDVVVYGRPEGMTIEHCVLSAAYDRVPATCRDLCVREHPLVQITDQAGYTFPVATDYACRNRLLHSRPIEGSEYLPRLWAAGLRAYRLLFNVPGDPVGALVAAYRRAGEALACGEQPAPGGARSLVGPAFTRGHFAHAV